MSNTDGNVKKPAIAAALASGSTTAVLGAAFLTATTSVGPGYLNNTVLYTEQFMGAMFLIVIVTGFFDIVAHQFVWPIVCHSGKRIPDLFNELRPGLGNVLVIVLFFVAFLGNMGNMGGIAMSIYMVTGIDIKICTLIAGVIALLIFFAKNIYAAIDKASIYLGALMILLCVYIMFRCQPPVTQMFSNLSDADYPAMVSPIIALVGGSAGAYLTLTGSHRLLDAGLTGPENRTLVRKSALIGSLVGLCMRTMLFLAAFGVLAAGNVITDRTAPAAEIFGLGAGVIGSYMFAVVLFAASVTSAIGNSYTAVSMLKTLKPVFEEPKVEKRCLIAYIIVADIVMAFVGQPSTFLIVSGVINGFVLPAILIVMFLISRRPKIIGEGFHCPIYLKVFNAISMVFLSYAAIMAIPRLFDLF